MSDSVEAGVQYFIIYPPCYPTYTHQMAGGQNLYEFVDQRFLRTREKNHRMGPVWNLASELWSMRSNKPLPKTHGGILGCGLAMHMKESGKPDTGLNRPFKTTVSESTHLIWKIRCERRIAREDDPQKLHSEHGIHDSWVKAMSTRLTLDSLSTNRKKFGKKLTEAKLVLQTWEGCLLNNGELPRNWCGKEGVLVGIAPVRR
jgi:hypothetical protein